MLPKAECINCLCHYCDKLSCRYKKDARKMSVCFVRCYSKSDYVCKTRPTLCCDNFHHQMVRKHYRVVRKRSKLEDIIGKISAKEFLKMLGGGIDD